MSSLDPFSAGEAGLRDTPHSLRILSMAVAAAWLTGIAAPAGAQQIIWDVDGSAAVQASNPPSTELFTLQTPRGDLAGQGARAGQVVVEIERDQRQVSGVAYDFHAGCGTESYEISGAISSDDKVITLQGRAPVRDGSCKVISFRDRTLVLRRQDSPSPPVQAQSPPVQAQAPRPRVAGEQCAMRPAPGGTESYCASSVLASQFGNSYNVRNLFSGGSSEAWVEGQAGQGIGEWIVVEFNMPRRITGLLIDNGYQKNQDIYFKNSRPRSIEVRLSQGHSETLTLADRFGTQHLTLVASAPATWVQIVIRDVYPGSRYTDTAITKLSVESAPAN